MNDDKWTMWKMQTSETWEDVKDVLCAINIDFIDYDHKRLVEYALDLNRLTNQLERQFSLELLQEIKNLLDDLYDYAVYHFGHEEQFMDTYNLPDTLNHKAIHKDILKMIKEHIDAFKEGKVAVSHLMKNQLMDWLIGHINKVDFEFFNIRHWRQNLVMAESWQDLQKIISLIGISMIDNQHKDVTESALRIFYDEQGALTLQEVEKRYSYLLRRVKKHFEDEESFMIRNKIENMDPHIEAHRDFVAELESRQKTLNLNDNHLIEMKEWMLIWWINHINVTDQEMFNPDKWLVQLLSRSDTMSEMVEVLRLTHIGVIDHDHMMVISMIYDLNKYLSLPDKEQDEAYHEKVMELITAIYDRAKAHFSREEWIMHHYQFNDSLSHESEHRMILKRIETMKIEFDEGRLMASENIKTMLLDWWLKHTNSVDYRTFVINPNPELMKIIREEATNGLA